MAESKVAHYKRSIAARITGSFEGIPTDYVVAVVRAVRKSDSAAGDPASGPADDNPVDDNPASDSGHSVEAVIAHVIACVSCGVPDPLYIMTGGTYVSRDGEYRHRLLWYSNFMAAEFPDPLDNYVADLINENELGFHISLFGGASLDEERRGQILLRLEEDMVARRAFEACWMVDTVEYISTGLVPNHHHVNYARLMYRESLAEDKPILDEIMKTLSKGDIDKFTRFKLIQDIHGRLEVGCKYIPLTVGDLRDMVDPRVPVWKEYRLTQRLADLAVSGVACFPIIRGYFYVQNVGEGFFDNPEIQQDFLVQGDLRASIEQIKEAQLKLRRARDADPADRLRAVEEDLEQPLARADRYLRLSNLALATVMEHTGRTARDLPKITHQYIIDRAAGLFLPAVNTSMFASEAFVKVFFDWLWGFLAMHTEGLMHADPHLNNLTFQRISKTFQCDADAPAADAYQYYQVLELDPAATEKARRRIIATTPPVDFPFSEYVLRAAGAADSRVYLFPFFDIAGTAIDMSRAVQRDIPAGDVAIGEDILQGQIEWLLYLLQLFGEREGCADLIGPHRARLVYLMQTEWLDMWRLLSALDAWTLSFYWGGMLTEAHLSAQGLGDLVVHPAIRGAILRTHQTAVGWLKRALGQLLPSTLRAADVLANDPATAGAWADRRWAGKEGGRESTSATASTSASASASASEPARAGWHFPLQWIIERAFQDYEERQARPAFARLERAAPLGARPRGDARWLASPARRAFREPRGLTADAPDPNALVIDRLWMEAPRYSATDPARYAPETRDFLALLLADYSEEDRRRQTSLREACRREEPRERAFVDRAVEAALRMKGGGAEDAEAGLLEFPLRGF